MTAPLERWIRKYRVRVRFLFFALIILVIYFYQKPFQTFKITSEHYEMTPLITPGDSALLYKHDDWNYQVGDTILIKTKNNGSYRFMRIVAQDQGTVELKDGKLWIDGREDPHIDIPSKPSRVFPPLTTGQVFCVCNNQGTDVQDSLVSGVFDKSMDVKGKIFFVFKKSKNKK